MKTGAVFPQTESGTDVAALRNYVQTVESLGCDYLLCFDHVLGHRPADLAAWPGPYTDGHSFHEILTFFAWAAAITERIEFFTGIVILPQRQAQLVAKQAAEIDILSGGRLQLGIGIGWNQVELEGMGMNFGDRGRRAEEQIKLMRALWTQELVDFDGQYHQLRQTGINPLPVQRPIPVWIGGYADVVLRRAARLADGMLPGSDLAEGRSRVPRLRQYLADEGRDPDDFGINVWLNAGEIERAQWGDFVGEWTELGATHIALDTMNAGCESLSQHLALVEEFVSAFGSA